MIFSYRTRRVLRNVALILLGVLLLAAVIWGVWFLWLERFVIYTRDGAVLNFGLSQQPSVGDAAVEPEPEGTVSIYYDDGSTTIADTELKQMVGYYINCERLENDIAAIRESVKDLPAGTPVMLDVKSDYGNANYSSSVSDRYNSDVDLAAVDELIKLLDEKEMYLIARLPAFRDYYYGWPTVPNGLLMPQGYLWTNEENFYWLNPAKEGTMTFLIQTVNELESLGFDEVVFSHFNFPDTDEIVFDGDRTQALANAAQTLVTTCSKDTFAVSFTVQAGELNLPVGRSRLYLESVAAADAAAMAQLTGIENTAVNLVFLTEYHDTRFDIYSVLRPL